MIAYVLTVIKGSIHKPFMKIRMGTTVFGIDCINLRNFIRVANEVGIYQLLEDLDPEDREVFAILYEEFKDKV